MAARSEESGSRPSSVTRSLEREAMVDERTGIFALGTLGYSSSGWGHWPLIDAGWLSGMLNSYWPSANPGPLGWLSGALNSHWLSGDSSFSSCSLTYWDEARREELPKMHEWQRRTPGYH